MQSLEITVSTANLSLYLVPCLYIERVWHIGFGTSCIDVWSISCSSFTPSLVLPYLRAWNFGVADCCSIIRRVNMSWNLHLNLFLGSEDDSQRSCISVVICIVIGGNIMCYLLYWLSYCLEKLQALSWFVVRKRGVISAM